MSSGDGMDRVCLEGRDELLEATRQRYRVLMRRLRSFRWEERLRREAGLLREVTHAQSEVDEVLARVERRAKAEGWPADSEVLQVAREVRRLREALKTILAARLGAGDGTEPLGQRLEKLEARLLTSVPRVELDRHWRMALEALPAHRPELERLARFGAMLEAAFRPPPPPGSRLPFSLEHFEHLAARWDAGERDLAAVWRRLDILDPSGALGHHLRRRTRRPPVLPPRNGPEVLLHAGFWLTRARTRLDALISTRTEPVRCRESERLEVARWLWHRERDPEARLSTSERLSDGRAGLFELAYEWGALRALPLGAPVGWERLLERAVRADGARADADWSRLHEPLRLRLRVRLAPERREVPPLYRTLGLLPAPPSRQPEPETLADLVSALENAERR